jgi:hypothetical protein
VSAFGRQLQRSSACMVKRRTKTHKDTDNFLCHGRVYELVKHLN